MHHPKLTVTFNYLTHSREKIAPLGSIHVHTDRKKPNLKNEKNRLFLGKDLVIA
jgi:hypothetical protein